MRNLESLESFKKKDKNALFGDQKLAQVHGGGETKVHFEAISTTQILLLPPIKKIYFLNRKWFELLKLLQMI